MKEGFQSCLASNTASVPRMDFPTSFLAAQEPTNICHTSPALPWQRCNKMGMQGFYTPW